ncbi:MAG: TolC family protein [Deltaproteobacteria bacterium]|nr:TolC family protein [Deltaproteobacteria bacterium]
MNIRTSILIGIVSAAMVFLFSGCATTDPKKPFAGLKEEIKARTGTEIEWQRSLEARRHASQRIRSMLRDDLTLEEAIAIGLANNRRIQGLYQELGVAQAGVVQSQLLDNPHVGFAYLGSSSNLYKLELEAVTNILSLFLIPLRQALAEAQLARAHHRIAGLVLAHLFDIRRAYVMVQAHQQAYRLLERVLLSSEAAHEMAERLRDAGNMTRLELLSRRSLAEEDRLALSSASLAVFESRERLNRLMGLWGEDIAWTVKADLPAVPMDYPDLQEVEKRAVEASLDMALAKSRLTAGARELGITNVTSILPEFEMGAAFEREEDGMWFGGPAFALQLPIFDPGHAKRSKARAIVERHWEEFTALSVEVRSQAREAFRRLEVAREQALYYEKSFLPLRQAITQQAQRRYNGMFLGVFDLLMIKRMEIRASLGYIDALKTYWMAQSDMEELLAGKLPPHSTDMRMILPVSGGSMGQGGH